jgi:hypothetical protein
MLLNLQSMRCTVLQMARARRERNVNGLPTPAARRALQAIMQRATAIAHRRRRQNLTTRMLSLAAFLSYGAAAGAASLPPRFFFTFSASSVWQELKLPGQTVHDNAESLYRVFKRKLMQLLRILPAVFGSEVSSALDCRNGSLASPSPHKLRSPKL